MNLFVWVVLAWCPLYDGFILIFLISPLFLFCAAEFPLCLILSITVTLLTDAELKLTSALSRLRDVNKIKSPSISSLWCSKLFLKQLSFENNSKTLPVPKLLVYPIRQGIWMNAMSTQHGSVMEAITHCQERWACNTHLQPWFVIYFQLHWEKRHQVKFMWKKKGKRTGSCLTVGGSRQLAASFGSRGCQSWRDDGDWKWVRKEEAYLPLKRPRSI